MLSDIGTDISRAKEILSNFDVVAIPTESVYGLAANAYSEQAVKKIFEIKNRPFSNPLIVHTHSIDSLYSFVSDIPDVILDILEIFSPGPLTVLLDKKPIIPNLVTANNLKVAVRIPDHQLTLELLKSLEFPLAAPSANMFGYVSPTTAGHVYDDLNGLVPYILDGGKSKIGVESTIISIEDDSLVVHRLGAISLKDLQRVCDFQIKIKSHNFSTGLTPGLSKNHYAPKKKLLFGNIKELYDQNSEQKIAVVSFNNKSNLVQSDLDFVLSPDSDLTKAAHNLYAVLRDIDKLEKVDLIIVESFPNFGLGLVLNDRLRRGSYKK